MKKEENKIVLGTAQFSNNYGVTNEEFLNNYKIKKILQESLKFHIKTIDTAPNYKGVEKRWDKENNWKKWVSFSKMHWWARFRSQYSPHRFY